MKCGARWEQQAKLPLGVRQAELKGCSACLRRGRGTSAPHLSLLPLLPPREALAHVQSTGPTRKGHLLPTFNSSKNGHPHALTLFQPHPPPPLLLYERQKIRLLDCGEIDWQKKYLRMDIFKRRHLYVGQTRVCGIFHHHSQIFLICYLWILYSWIPLLSWRLFI